jgi:hypothetical protein
LPTTAEVFPIIATDAELYYVGQRIYLIATEAHGKKYFMVFILPRFSVFFRVLPWQSYPSLLD